MKALILIMILGSAAQAQVMTDDLYIRANQVPASKQISKLEAMRTLIVSQGKEAVYRCRIQEMSSKGTIKNR